MPILNRVLPGSPGDLAGLRAGDRIHRIAGQEFATDEEFRQLAGTLPGPLELTVETAGRLRSVTLHPADESRDPAAGDDESGKPNPPSAVPAGP